MKYVFPRQFKLHNVFNSTVDPNETVQPFRDYTLREHEIAQSKRRASRKKGVEIAGPRSSEHHVPKRLRGATFELIRNIQKNHSRCSYHQLLRHYCPLKASNVIRLVSCRLLTLAGEGQASETGSANNVDSDTIQESSLEPSSVIEPCRDKLGEFDRPSQGVLGLTGNSSLGCFSVLSSRTFKRRTECHLG